MPTQISLYKNLLWILYGFVIITAGQSCTEALIYAYAYYGFNNGFLEIHFNYYIPAFSGIMVFATSLLTISILKKMLVKGMKNRVKFPITALILITVFSVCISFLPKFIFDENFKLLYNDYSKFNYISSLDIDMVFKSIEISVFVSRWIILLLILCYSLFFTKKARKLVK